MSAVKPAGLTTVTTVELKKLLAAVHREQVACPLDVAALTRVGLQHRVAELLAVLRDLDRKAVHALLVAVLAERLLIEGDERPS